MNDEYKKMLERFEQICQNAKKELCGKKEKELEKRFIEKINKELTINGYDEIEYWLASVEALDNNAINDILEENKRLNNIINDFEKYLIEEIEDYEKQIKYHKKNKDLRSGILDLVGEYEGEKVCFEDMLGKLQELKGEDKE